ncbi:hypothetical protein [Streptomyces sp. NPDC001536]|uniref:hypothetical protein n=1 Tax=Streptomyces sp. NPDC001536 TaxID=3364583 RepID=UPI0036A09ABE
MTASTARRSRVTATLGAASVGFAMPAEEAGTRASVTVRVERAGRALVPAFFVVTGVTVLTGHLPGVSTGFILLVVALGAWTRDRKATPVRGWPAGHGPTPTAAQFLTELIVLQAGFSAGILAAPMELSLILVRHAR